jgi:hypothetical protein
MSEKLDGCRGYWDGNELISKKGMLMFAIDHISLLFTYRNNYKRTAKLQG